MSSSIFGVWLAMTLADRVAIVTGAGRGIGKATALALAEAGSRSTWTAASSSIDAPVP
jgi:NAD(P)-dependent dehydrogenase (short-subunit alcohol dehydrogenase family)